MNHGERADGLLMPYVTNSDLPSAVRRRLPDHAQDIYREAFNHAHEAHRGEPQREERAHKIAWGAVKRIYEKVGDRWIPRQGR
jgi:cation transport regulator